MFDSRIEGAEGEFAVNDTSLEGGRKQNLVMWTSCCGCAMLLAVPKVMSLDNFIQGSAFGQALSFNGFAIE